ncbi:MAG: hypothetical protein Q9187_007488 [Circinaria calcarea]
MASLPTTPTTPSTPRTPRTPGFNTKSPTIKRILQESRELSLSPDPTLHASPLDDNLFEWHFTLAGPPATPYANGIYHGRIILPPTYPLRPPSFRFLTPSGRFEVNREICLSISGHHEESWQPAWGIRTALCAIRAFMAGEAKGQVGGLEMGEAPRKRIASESRTWRCTGCWGKTNEEVLKEVQDLCDEKGEGERKEEMVPEELRLAYREEMESRPGTPRTPGTPGVDSSMGGRNGPSLPPSSIPALGRTSRSKPPPSPLRATASSSTSSSTSVSEARTPLHPAPPTSRLADSTSSVQTPTPATPNVVPPTPTQVQVPTVVTAAEPVPAWVDKAIVGVVLGLAVMLLKKMYI